MGPRDILNYLLVFATFGSSVTICLYGKKIGYGNLNIQHYLVILGFFFGLCFILPTIYFTKISVAWKIVEFFGLIIFAYIRYIVTTKAQNSIRDYIKRTEEKNK